MKHSSFIILSLVVAFFYYCGAVLIGCKAFIYGLLSWRTQHGVLTASPKHRG